MKFTFQRKYDVLLFQEIPNSLIRDWKLGGHAVFSCKTTRKREVIDDF